MPSDDDILRIAAQFDVGSITAGMDEAAATVASGTSKMNDSFSNLANAQIRVTSANKELRETLSATVSGGLSPTVNATEEVAAAMFEAKTATDAFKLAQEEAYGATERMTGGVNNSRIAFTGLTQDLGVRGSRALGSFISQSEVLGPILQAAFPVVAVIAFVEILDAGVNKLIEFTSALAGWDKEAQKMYSHIVDLNQAQIKFNAELDIEKLSMSEVGLKGAALDRQKLINLKIEEQIVTDKLSESMKRQQSLSADLAALKHPNVLGVFPDKQKIADVDSQLQKAVDTTQEWANKLQTIQQFTIPKTGMEEVAKATEEAQKAAEKYSNTLAKMRDENTAITQRDAEKELRELEKLMNEKERMEEEEEKTTLDLAKKDLETFERTITQKARLQEQFGRQELEQMRASSEAQSKVVQSRSIVGAADPELIRIADKALDDQAFKIMDLIALEEKLRETLFQTGMAETDPKIQESLGRQQELVQQLNVAMQKYSKTLQQIGQAELRQFEQNFNQLTSSINKGILSWVDGSEKFGKAMQQVWTGIVNSALEGILKMGEKWLENQIEMAVIGKATGTTAATSQIGAAAGEAFANTYAAISAIPVVGPAMAPGMAAAAASAALSGGLAFLAFEQGGIMPNTESLALLHPREMVLPSNLSESVQRMASNGSGGGGSARGGPMHVHINVSGSPSSGDLAKIEKQMVGVVKRARRRGAF